ncbi:type I polyketide synthase [Anthocerotibacter panamensis]|uniref:type I polyketide synthase n=1 Tax=Anthocerotibacter panamensis TaxID=2857077 RepID=UPI001C4075D9|nr:type I polyketide synthase [Anthocerotibacter panamensis]
MIDISRQEPGNFQHWVELLRYRALEQGEQPAYIFLHNGQEECLTYGALDRQSRAIAARLQQLKAQGKTALLLYPPGLDYIAAFLGCLYAGVIAVPAYPLLKQRGLPRIQNMVADCRPHVALTAAQSLGKMRVLLAEGADLGIPDWVLTDELAVGSEAAWRMPVLDKEALAFLQYTSGSTGRPKGVMVSHRHLLENSALIAANFGHTPEAVGVSWLPLYHDMGLVGATLQVLYVGFPLVLLSPAEFLQRPRVWLEAISRYRGTTSGGPNFAYDLCVTKISPEQRVGLDLSRWEVAFSGAEPVRAATLERFGRAFAPQGFRQEAFHPCYGMAEATLFISGARKGVLPQQTPVQKEALAQGRWVAGGEPAQVLVGCGQPGERVVIVHPETMHRCGPGELGEIWVGGSVAGGYWQNQEETTRTFQAHLATGEGPFLRTGDLGYRDAGELFITGRRKDLIILQGRNLYPQDIEGSVERSHLALKPGCGAAFAVTVADCERLVVVQEVKSARQIDAPAVLGAVRQAVAEEHAVGLYAIVLLRPGSLAKTSSGKIQRFANREHFLAGTLEVVAQWCLEADASQSVSVLASAPSARAIEDWLSERLARHLGIASTAIEVQQSFAYYGLGSTEAVSLIGDLERWLGRTLLPTLAWDYPTIAALAHFLAGSDRASATDKTDLEPSEPIAIVGLGCRFPGAKDPEAFWQLLRTGQGAIGVVPAARWSGARVGPLAQGGFVEGVDRFDAPFFKISPREARAMDPQQRLLLEVAWETLEHGGLAPLAQGRSGVFIGVSSHDYAQLLAGAAEDLDLYTGTGCAHSLAANRLSYYLDWHGPSLAVDTACSSSLVAVHLACQHLRTKECDFALAGGVNVLLTPDLSAIFARAGMLAADGRCKTFDAAADGYVRSEGCGLVALKRLKDAERDGDQIWAVLRGSAVNQDGRSNGLTAPNGAAQQAVIREALAHAGVLPQQIGYVETHGTGTPLGDPIEVQALKAVLEAGRRADERCVLGSVKTNIGHLEAAAGIAGLIKTVLALRHGLVPPHLHLKQLNPHLELEGTPFSVATSACFWPQARRLAGVSSFGLGGTNAHVVLEAAPAVAPAEQQEPCLQLLTLSARTEPALRDLARRYAHYLSTHPETVLRDVCATANIGRAHLPERLAVLTQSTTQLQAQLTAFGDQEQRAGLVTGPIRGRQRVAFLFTGQGAQYAGMGRELYARQPVFRASLDRAAQILEPWLEQPLLTVLFAPELIHQTAYAQPALFALEYALVELWRSWGIEPDFLLGHSFGEYVAACVAGVFSLEDGLRLVAARARLMQALPEQGQMAVVFAAAVIVREVLQPFGGSVVIAAFNAPEHTVIAGKTPEVTAVLAAFAQRGIKTRPLKMAHACHSPLMAPMLPELYRVAQTVTYHPPHPGWIATCLGAGPNTTPEYWCAHLLEPVQFARGLEQLPEDVVLLEVGPKPTLLGLAGQNFGKRVGLASLRPGQPEEAVLLESLSVLYTQGATVNWAAMATRYQRLALPTYPFQRERYWLSPAPKPNPSHPLLGQRLVSPLPQVQFSGELQSDAPAFLGDHRVFQTVVLPAAAFLEMVLAAGAHVLKTECLTLEQVVIERALVLTQEPKTVQVVLRAESQRGYHVQVLSLEGETQWTCHATGWILPGAEAPESRDLAGIQERCAETVPIAQYYERYQARDIDYGPGFRVLRHLLRQPGESLAWVDLAQSDGRYLLHPALLDGCFQGVAAALSGWPAGCWVPVSCAKLHLYGRVGSGLWSHARVQQHADFLRADLGLMAPDGQILATVEGLQVQPVRPEALLGTTWCYEVVWREMPAVLPTPAALEAQLDPVLEPDTAALDHLEALSLEYGWRALQDLGGKLDPGQRFTLEEIAATVVKPQQSLLKRLLAMFVEARLLRSLNTGWEVLKAPTNTAFQSGASAEWTLLERCGTHLAAVLTGRCDPLELLFPQGDLTTLTQVYQESPTARRMNTWLGQVLCAVLEQRCRPLRVLEIGAGTGATTAYLLPHLPPDAEYVFTDLSPLFLKKGRDKFQDYPYVRYKTLDIEQDPLAQGFLAHHYDIVVAANVLHATRDLRQTLAHVQQLLTAGGLLLLLEVAGERPVRWLDLTFGLTEGWWRFADHDLRPDYPLLPVQRWCTLLEACGFSSTKPLRAAHQAVVIAQAPLAPARSDRNWLILADRQGVGQQLADQLALRGEAATLVFAQDLDLTLPEDFHRLIQDAARPWQGVVHLWSLDAGTEDLDRALEKSCASTLHLVQALLRAHLAPRLWLVTRGAQAVGTAAPTGVAQATLWGMGRVIAREHPELGGVLIDLDPESSAHEIQHLLTEITHTPAEEQVAFRGTTRLGARLVRAPLESGNLPSSALSRIPLTGGLEGTYLITGGLGGLGLLVSDWLVAQGARNLVLVGRSHPDREAQARVRALEHAGARVLVLQADIAQAQEVVRVLATIERTLPPLRGVIHGAGVLADGALSSQNWERFTEVMGAKVQGAWNLHTLTQDHPLDFFVLFSSVAALLGSPGQANHAAANAFLDTLAWERRAQGLPALSINWGPWAEVGKAAHLERDPLRRLGMIPPEQGIRLLGELLGQDATQVGVFVADWAQLLPASAEGWPGFLAELASGGQAAWEPLPTHGQTREERPPVLADYLRAQVAGALGAEEFHLDPEAPLLNSGLDSLTALELRNRVNRDLGVDVPVVKFLEGLSLADLTNFIAVHLEESPAAATQQVSADANEDWEEGAL